MRDERGLALPIAVGIMMVLAIALVAVIGFTSAGARDTNRSQAENEAYAAAEAGVNVALSILGKADDPTVGNLLQPETEVVIDGATVRYSGTYASPIWTITSTARLPNPTDPNAAEIARTLNQKVTVQPLVPGATAPEWDRFFHNRTDVCLTIDTVTVPASVTSRGDLCLVGTAKITTNGRTKVEVGDDVTLAAPNTSIGVSGSPISRAEVVGTCRYGTQTPASPCGPSDQVFADTYTTTPPNLTKPTVDMAYWYQNAKPGPKHDCDTPGSFPGGFDNNTVMDRSLPDYGNDNEDLDQLTPTNTSYTCTVTENGVLKGEVSWNHVTHVLRIHGQIFIDGNVRFDRDGQLVNYQGRGIIYAAGDLEYDEVVCAGGDGTHNCHGGDMSDWNPEQNMMIILSGGWSEYDQGDDCCPLRPAAFQGVMYARDHCLIHQDFKSSGPILCDEIQIRNTDGSWPDFYAWPELQSLIAGQMYGSFAMAADYRLILGEQTG
jgi:hypothetical protein